MITRQMRQQIVEAKKRLENYANCLDEFFDDVVKLTSLDTAKQLAEDLLCYEPLKTAAAQKSEKMQRQRRIWTCREAPEQHKSI